MSFKFPLGLLGLIGIPILILIYIIKSKYTEQTIASTYLWTLSEKFLKKRKPISKLTGIITLILQILAIVAVSFLIAQPVFTLRNAAEDIYFILDGSASMNMQSEGGSRFDRAKERICDIIDAAPGGSAFTLVMTGESTDVVFEAEKDKTQAKSYVEALKSGWCAVDCADAGVAMQNFYDINRSAKTYLLTDRPFTTANVELLNVAGGENNFSFEEYSFVFAAEGVVGRGSVLSFNSDADVTVGIYAADTADGEAVKAGETRLRLEAGVAKDFEIATNVTSYARLELRISGSDALIEDNAVVLYDEAKTQSRKALIISSEQDSIYIRSALQAAGKCQVEVLGEKQYKEEYEKAGRQLAGYGLYVFNGFTPEYLPTNAAIWLIDAVEGPVKGSGISFRDMQIPRDAEGPNSYYLTKYTTGTSTLEKMLTKGLIRREVAVRQYAKLGVPRSFTPVMRVDNDVVVAAGLNENNDREVVFAFAIGDSELGLYDDFLVLVRNLTEYAFPSVVDGTVFSCGDTLNVNVVPGCANITVTSPSGKNTTLDTVDSDVCELRLDEAGTYKFNVKLTTGDEITTYAYAAVPKAESGAGAEGALMLSGEPENNLADGYYDDLLAFFIVLAVLMLADWGVYCYEQYQLR